MLQSVTNETNLENPQMDNSNVNFNFCSFPLLEVDITLLIKPRKERALKLFSFSPPHKMLCILKAYVGEQTNEWMLDAMCSVLFCIHIQVQLRLFRYEIDNKQLADFLSQVRGWMRKHKVLELVGESGESIKIKNEISWNCYEFLIKYTVQTIFFIQPLNINEI